MGKKRAKATIDEGLVAEFRELWKDAPWPRKPTWEMSWWEQFFQVLSDCGMYQWFKSCNGKVH